MAVGASVGVTVTFNSVALGQLVDVSHSGMQAGTIDTTYQGSTADASGIVWRTHAASGIAEPGELTCKVLFDGSLPAIGTVASLVIDYVPLGESWTWTGAIYTGFDPGGNLGSELVANVKFKLSGAPSVAADTAPGGGS